MNSFPKIKQVYVTSHALERFNSRLKSNLSYSELGKLLRDSLITSLAFDNPYVDHRTRKDDIDSWTFTVQLRAWGKPYNGKIVNIALVDEPEVTKILTVYLPREMDR